MLQRLARLIAMRLHAGSTIARDDFMAGGRVRAFVIDDLLPSDLARAIHDAFPAAAAMMRRHTIREAKFVTAQLDRCDPLVAAAVFAFQDAAVLAAIANITGIAASPDPSLYAGGISSMGRGDFLHPHLDNSHDATRCHYRALNALYYVTPDWTEADGGSLELWDDGPRCRPRAIASRFNRLVVMATDRQSWHSVNRIQSDRLRNCVSNFYFTAQPPGGDDHFHVTTFRGRPEQPVLDRLLQIDSTARATARLLFPNGLGRSTHVYRRR